MSRPLHDGTLEDVVAAATDRADTRTPARKTYPSSVENRRLQQARADAFLDGKARKVWSFWGVKVAWDGGSGDSPLVGTKDPKSFNVPGSAPLMGWDVISTAADGSKKICVYGSQGAEYIGTAHG
jgi:hypothetical protein